MTIHEEHPFVPPEGQRDPVRRLRGRLPSPVSVWTSLGPDGRPAGLTVSSLLVADGEPPRVLALVDEDADLTDAVLASRTAAVSVLRWEHRDVAEVFAGAAPSPGGAFRTGRWTDTAWGPVLDGAVAWAGVRLVDGEPRQVGWPLLLEAVVEHVELADDAGDAVVHLRGRYREP